VSLYFSPRGIYEFQARGAAEAYMRAISGWRANLILWDTGTGKSHLAMILAALLFEDGLIDHVLLAAESDKLKEWVKDFESYTTLSTVLYHSKPLAKRQEIMAAPPQVIVSTYETIRNDAAHDRPKSAAALDSGFLTEGLAGKRVLVVYDEATKLKNRTSALYRHHAHLLRTLRKASVETSVTAMTATPVERSPENAFNVARLLMPGFLSVEDFLDEHVASFTIDGEPRTFKNIGEADHYNPSIETFQSKLAPIVQVKRKSDPDVVDFFPRQVEEFSYVDQSKREGEFYQAAEEAIEEYVANSYDPESMQMASFGVLRQIAGLPSSLIHSGGALAQYIVHQVGEAGLLDLGSAKLDRLVRYLEPLIKGQGAQAVIFTFYGKSILPVIEQRLIKEGYRVASNSGQMTRVARDQSRERFIARDADIFLSSDAGSRGINLATAEYVVNYELPLTHANYIQRINRIHRIDSEHPSVTAQSFITAHTIEEAIVGLNVQRNEWSDLLLDDEEDLDAAARHLTAGDRKRLLGIARDTRSKIQELPWAA
jgi:SNF2 family DNA or RNA helicase